MGQPFVFDREFIALARARPGQLNYASAGVGSPQHVTGALCTLTYRR